MATKVMGLDRLKRQLLRLPPEMVAAARTSLADGAREVAAAIARAAPRDSGALAASVGWSQFGDAPKTKATGALRADSSADPTLKNAGLTVTVYAGDDKAYYARWVEFGTAPAPAGQSKDKAGKTRTNKRPHAGTRAQPFFYPTVRALRRRVKSRVVRNANRAAKAAAAVK